MLFTFLDTQKYALMGKRLIAKNFAPSGKSPSLAKLLADSLSPLANRSKNTVN